MRNAAGSDAEYAGMAVQPTHGGRGQRVVEWGEKQTDQQLQRVSLWLSSPAAGHTDGNHVPHGTQVSSGWLHTVFCHRAQTKWSGADSGRIASLRTGRIHTQDGSDAKWISCAIFWHMCPTRRKTFSRSSWRPSGWHLPRSRIMTTYFMEYAEDWCSSKTYLSE